MCPPMAALVLPYVWAILDTSHKEMIRLRPYFTDLKILTSSFLYAYASSLPCYLYCNVTKQFTVKWSRRQVHEQGVVGL